MRGPLDSQSGIVEIMERIHVLGCGYEYPSESEANTTRGTTFLLVAERHHDR